MKRIILFFMLPACLISCAQEKEVKQQSAEQFNCKYVKLVQDTLKMMLIENVVISYGDLYAETDSALLEKPLETVTLYGIKKAVFKGKELSKDELKGVMRYRKGGDMESLE